MQQMKWKPWHWEKIVSNQWLAVRPMMKAASVQWIHFIMNQIPWQCCRSWLSIQPCYRINWRWVKKMANWTQITTFYQNRSNLMEMHSIYCIRISKPPYRPSFTNDTNQRHPFRPKRNSPHSIRWKMKTPIKQPEYMFCGFRVRIFGQLNKGTEGNEQSPHRHTHTLLPNTNFIMLLRSHSHFKF